MCYVKPLPFSSSSTCLGLKTHTEGAMSCSVTYSTGIIGRSIHVNCSGPAVEGTTFQPGFVKGFTLSFYLVIVETLEFSWFCFGLVFFLSN